MNRWAKRFIYLIITLVWLSIMLFPIFAFRLATNGRVEVGNTTVFLVQERRQGGVGFQTTRELDGEGRCVYNAVRFVMWQGEAQSTRNCTCSDGVMREPRGRSCVAP